MIRIVLLILLTLSLQGCIKAKIHQGNVIDENSIWIIQEGDTRFAIESELGSPTIQDDTHPERSLYIDYFYDEETNETYTRGVEVIYDKAWRAITIRRFGFE